MLKFNVLSNETPGRVIEVKDDVKNNYKFKRKSWELHLIIQYVQVYKKK